MPLNPPPSFPNRDAASPWLAHAAAMAAVALATGAAMAVDRLVSVPNLSLVFVLPVVLAAVSFGWGAALTAVVAGTAAYNFFLIEPRYTLRIADPANIWALFLLLVTAAIVSAVAAQSHRRAREAWQAADQAAALHGLARALVAEVTREGVAIRCAEALAQVFRSPAVVLLDHNEGLRPFGLPEGAALADADLEAARWALAVGLATRGGFYPAGDAAFDFWPVVTPLRRRAVIGLRISLRETGRPTSPERLVEIVAGYLAVALDREAYAAQAMESRMHAESERLKSDLIAAVSHDLRTPLSTILLTLQSLRKFGPSHDAKARDVLLAAAELEAARLRRMVENLLDMNRLDSGAVPVRPKPASPADLTAAAKIQAAPALGDRHVVDETESEPRLLVDSALFETALANLLENAGKYSAPGSTVRVRSGAQDGAGWVEVTDEGPGFEGAIEPLFARFARGRDHDGRAPGVGLGLSIARGFLEAQGGRVEAANREDGRGARLRLIAPLAAP